MYNSKLREVTGGGGKKEKKKSKSRIISHITAAGEYFFLPSLFFLVCIFSFLLIRCDKNPPKMQERRHARRD